MMESVTKKKIAILGAGAAGLISMKICVENGLVPVCFEMTSDIGGLWNYDTALINQKGSVMKSTIINTSKENMAFSDFPAPKDFPNFMHNKKVLEYFRLYANQFKLIQYIRFNTKIIKINKTKNYDLNGQWEVISIDEKDSKEAISEIFDGVMICNGHHANPNIPIISGLNDENAKFKGEVIHSWQYREPFSYIDKRVLVIGVGNSGGDIACELSRIASQVYLSTRHGMWCTPRTVPGGLPGDYVHFRRINNFLGTLFPNYFYGLYIKSLNDRIDHELYAIRPNTTGQHHAFANEDLPNRIASGTLVIKSNYKEFGVNSCTFDDDTVAENIDTVILATGYNIGFPLFDNDIISVKDNWVNLYKYVFPPQLKHGTLAVIGCVQPLGSLNPIIELQARWVVRVIKGESKLPSKKVMDDDIKFRAENIRKRYYLSNRHTIQVDFIPYLDEIADRIGCKPKLAKYFFSDFELWKNIVFGALTPYQYRLNGPGANYKQAREHILTQHERVIAPFKTRYVAPINENKSRSILKFPIYLIIFYLLFKKMNTNLFDKFIDSFKSFNFKKFLF